MKQKTIIHDINNINQPITFYDIIAGIMVMWTVIAIIIFVMANTEQIKKDDKGYNNVETTQQHYITP